VRKPANVRSSRLGRDLMAGAPKHSTAASPQWGSSGRAFTPFENRSSLAEAQRAREWLRVKKEKLTVELLERPSRASAGHSPTWSAELRILESGQILRQVKLNSRGLIDTESAAAQWEANKDARQWQRGAPATRR
jgi:hypothetical protein